MPLSQFVEKSVQIILEGIEKDESFIFFNIPASIHDTNYFDINNLFVEAMLSDEAYNDSIKNTTFQTIVFLETDNIMFYMPYSAFKKAPLLIKGLDRVFKAFDGIGYCGKLNLSLDKQQSIFLDYLELCEKFNKTFIYVHEGPSADKLKNLSDNYFKNWTESISSTPDISQKDNREIVNESRKAKILFFPVKNS